MEESALYNVQFWNCAYFHWGGNELVSKVTSRQVDFLLQSTSSIVSQQIVLLRAK